MTDDELKDKLDKKFEADMAKLEDEYKRHAEEHARVCRVLIELADRLDRIERHLGLSNAL